MNEFLEQFVLEARELVEQATGDLLALERAPDDKARLDSAFRAFHTLKGGAGIVDFRAMARAVHAAEDALSAVRSGERAISAGLIGDCLTCLDQVVQWLDQIQASGDLPAGSDAAAETVAARFSREDEQPQPQAPAHLSPTARRVLDEQILLIAEPGERGRAGRLASAARVAANVLRHAAREVDAAKIERLSDAAELTNAIEATLGTPAEPVSASYSAAEGTARTLRVDAGRVDALVNLAGELLVAKNALSHLAKTAEGAGNPLAPALKSEHARLDRLVLRLQESVLGLRVLPLRTVFQRFSRVVREMAVSLEKPANLVIEGEGTEADKTLVEMLFEPLLHVVRNAMDHGIETAAERPTAGKPVVATLGLRARRQGEHVLVEVSDDGRGVDLERVRETAIARGIVTEETASAMAERDIVELVFAPGFSTARELTGLSGRGVGMDAVRTAVQRVGGSVTMESVPGQGTTVRFVLPYSVMMTRVMTVEAGDQMFGIPLEAVVETLRLPRDRIQPIGRAGAFVLRDRTVPLIDLAETLGRPCPDRSGSDAIVVVASLSGQLGAIEVDRIGERLEVMLKPMDGLLSGTPGIAGTTLTGDGRVLLVLDLQDLL